MIVAIPWQPNGMMDPRWGKAHWVVIATVTDDQVTEWQEYEVKWDEWHDKAEEGQHHARVARFLQEHRVDTVMASHMGGGMQHMLERMKIHVTVGVMGNAREVVAEGIRS